MGFSATVTKHFDTQSTIYYSVVLLSNVLLSGIPKPRYISCEKLSKELASGVLRHQNTGRLY